MESICSINYTLGILITKCPVIFDRSAVESVVFTSSGRTNCKIYDKQKNSTEESLNKIVLFL
jgi:hypothetical protein